MQVSTSLTFDDSPVSAINSAGTAQTKLRRVDTSPVSSTNTAGKAHIRLRGIDSVDLLDDCSKNAKNMIASLSSMTPSEKYRKVREDVERKSVLCKLLNSLLETKRNFTLASIDTPIIDAQINETVAKLI